MANLPGQQLESLKQFNSQINQFTDRLNGFLKGLAHKSPRISYDVAQHINGFIDWFLSTNQFEVLFNAGLYVPVNIDTSGSIHINTNRHSNNIEKPVDLSTNINKPSTSEPSKITISDIKTDQSEHINNIRKFRKHKK